MSNTLSPSTDAQAPEQFTVVKHLETLLRNCEMAEVQCRAQAEQFKSLAQQNAFAADEIRRALSLMRPM